MESFKMENTLGDLPERKKKLLSEVIKSKKAILLAAGINATTLVGNAVAGGDHTEGASFTEQSDGGMQPYIAPSQAGINAVYEEKRNEHTPRVAVPLVKESEQEGNDTRSTLIQEIVEFDDFIQSEISGQSEFDPKTEEGLKERIMVKAVDYSILTDDQLRDLHNELGKAVQSLVEIDASLGL